MHGAMARGMLESHVTVTSCPTSSSSVYYYTSVHTYVLIIKSTSRRRLNLRKGYKARYVRYYGL